MTSKYARLADHLATLDAPLITLTFAGIEAIVGPLPALARRDRYWWGATALARYASAHIHAWWRPGTPPTSPTSPPRRSSSAAWRGCGARAATGSKACAALRLHGRAGGGVPGLRHPVSEALGVSAACRVYPRLLNPRDCPGVQTRSSARNGMPAPTMWRQNRCMRPGTAERHAAETLKQALP